MEFTLWTEAMENNVRSMQVNRKFLRGAPNTHLNVSERRWAKRSVGRIVRKPERLDGEP